jgi:RimJ/RimL family protein N-acetyltransferase
MDIHPIVLSGRTVRLEPLAESHVPGLASAGKDLETWSYLPYGQIKGNEAMLAHVRWLLARADAGTDLPFTVIRRETNQPIGATRYLEISRQHRSLEIGGTWYGRQFRRTAVNTETKYLLLQHAFESLGCQRVQFKTDVRNTRSQHALERIGAVKEGILRNHMILPDGHVRDSVYYSIIADEWSGIKTHLEEKLRRSY